MAPVHLIVLNLIYDLSCIALPFDNVDKEFLKKPRIWEANSIMRFMAWIGPISSVFDIITYMLLYFLVVPMILEVMATTMEQQMQQPLSWCSKLDGLSNLCGLKPWLFICCVHQNCHLSKVVQPSQSW